MCFLLKKKMVKKNIKINLSFSNKTAYTLIIILILAVISGFVYAYNPTGTANPSVMGHSANELDVNIAGTKYTLQSAIDNNLLGGGGSCYFGAWQDLTSSASTGVNQAAPTTDGFVVAYNDGNINREMYLETPVGTKIQSDTPGQAGVFTASITSPIKKGNDWKIVNARKVYWIPLVCSSSSQPSSSVYDSGWFEVTIGTTYTKEHGLGSIPTDVNLWFSDTPQGTGRVVVGPYGETGAKGMKIVDIDSKDIKIRANDFICNVYDADGILWQPPVTGPAYARITARL